MLAIWVYIQSVKIHRAKRFITSPLSVRNTVLQKFMRKVLLNFALVMSLLHSFPSQKIQSKFCTVT